MNAKDYLKLHRTKYLIESDEVREVMYQIMEDYSNHVIKEHNEWQSISDDDEMGEPCDSDLYCSCGEEIENIGDTVCLDCFNEMTFND